MIKLKWRRNNKVLKNLIISSSNGLAYKLIRLSAYFFFLSLNSSLSFFPLLFMKNIATHLLSGKVIVHRKMSSITALLVLNNSWFSDHYYKKKKKNPNKTSCTKYRYNNKILEHFFFTWKNVYKNSKRKYTVVKTMQSLLC